MYRIRDAAGKDISPESKDKGPLHAMLTVISEQLAVLEENFDQLYDDQFIETCEEWVVPYIGDLVGTKGIISFPGAPFSQRGQVAKTIAYRRRKGTAAVVEELAFDVTGWNANVVEYFQLLATHQFLNHLRPDNLSVAPIRSRKLLEYINTPFDKITHTADIRRIESKRGKYNIPNIGIFLWRIQNYFLDESPAYKVDDRRYKFDALGKDIALYNDPVTEEEITHLAEPVNVPMPIRRFPFSKSPATYYGEDKSLLIFKDGSKVLPSSESEKLSDLICICDLSDVKGSSDPVPDWTNMPLNKIGIDPVLGRIALPSSSLVGLTGIKVNYNYGFSADIGGGSYERLDSFSTQLKPIVKVPADAATIKDALDLLGVNGGVVEIGNNAYHNLMSAIDVAAKTKIEIRAAEDHRPVLIINNELTITGGDDAEISLNGLLFCGGKINIPLNNSSGALNKLHAAQFIHCTLVPGLTPFEADPSVSTNPRLIAGAENIAITIAKCIVGGMRIADTAKANIKDSILDAGDQKEIAYAGLADTDAGAALMIQDSTVIGRVKTIIMELASNTIFDAEPGTDANELPVEAERLQEGCVRFSYVPLQSRLPKPYHCQPKSEQDAQAIRPVFTSLRYGDATYCQLSPHCAVGIRQGAENDMEMGVFYHLYQPLREFNLRTRLNEYLRFGLEAGIFYGS
jgi:hypothetical protein